MAIRHSTRADSSFSAQGKTAWEADHTGDASDLSFVQSGSALLRGSVAAAINDLCFNVKNAPFNALGDGSTDDTTAIVAAMAAATTAGGGIVYFPPGTYKTTTRLQPPSNVWLVGAGHGASKIKNTGSISPANIAIDLRGTLGTAYAINSTTEGGTTVTTTTAADAANFSAGDDIAVAGALISGDYYPFFITTVTSASGGTGVITLDEKVRRTGGFTQVFKITTLIQNAGVRDLAVTQASDVGILVKYAKNIDVSGNRIATAGTTGLEFIGSRNVVVERNTSNKPIGCHSLTDSSIQRNHLVTGYVTFEGACEDVSFAFNKVDDPVTNGVNIQTQSRRIKVAFNEIRAVANLCAGVQSLVDSGFGGENIIMGNHISGANVGDYGVASNADNDLIVGNIFYDLDIGITASGANTGIGPNLYFSCTTEWQLTSGSMGSIDGAILNGSATYDPASLNDGAGATTTVPVTGAALGDFAEASFSLDLQGITLTAWVSTSNTVSVRFQNESGGVLDLSSGTLRARVKKKVG